MAPGIGLLPSAVFVGASLLVPYPGRLGHPAVLFVRLSLLSVKADWYCALVFQSCTLDHKLG